jgi:hypothetical protein
LPTTTKMLTTADVVSGLMSAGFAVAKVHPSDVTVLFAREEVNGTINGVASSITVFSTTGGREAWLSYVLGFGRAAVVGAGDQQSDLWGVNPTKEQGGLDLAA